MREIKFRAWIDKGGIQAKAQMVKVIALHEDRIGYLTARKSILYIQPFALMQYTGFKDAKNQEIYEGDICIGVVESGWSFKFVVKWHGSGFVGYTNQPLNEQTTATGEDFVLKVIGNIYENKELLGGMN